MANNNCAVPCFRCGKWFGDERSLWVHRRNAHGAAGAPTRRTAASATPLMSVRGPAGANHLRPTTVNRPEGTRPPWLTTTGRGALIPAINPGAQAGMAAPTTATAATRNVVVDSAVAHEERMKRRERLELLVEVSCRWSKRFSSGQLKEMLECTFRHLSRL